MTTCEFYHEFYYNEPMNSKPFIHILKKNELDIFFSAFSHILTTEFTQYQKNVVRYLLDKIYSLDNYKYWLENNLKTILENHLLLNDPRVIITPHNAFNSKEALTRILDTTIDNISGFLSNKPINLVTWTPGQKKKSKRG